MNLIVPAGFSHACCIPFNPSCQIRRAHGETDPGRLGHTSILKSWGWAGNGPVGHVNFSKQKFNLKFKLFSKWHSLGRESRAPPPAAGRRCSA